MSTDERLLDRVRAAFAELEPLPACIASAGRAAFGWRVPGALLADLTAYLDAATAGLRGGARLLTFNGPGVRVDLEVTGAGEVAGRLDPPAAARVLVRHPDVSLTCGADEGGHFVLSGMPAGLVSLVFGLPDGTSIVTSWVRL